MHIDVPQGLHPLPLLLLLRCYCEILVTRGFQRSHPLVTLDTSHEEERGWEIGLKRFVVNSRPLSMYDGEIAVFSICSRQISP